METIKEIQFTEQDFNLLVEGLEHLPEKGMAGNLMIDILGMALIKDDGEREKMELKRETKRRKEEAAKEILQEDIRILQGKLLRLKRHMIANNFLIKANDILNN